MKNINCEDFKPGNRNGQKERCHCAYLNRKWNTRLKLFSMDKVRLESEKKGSK